MSCFIRGCKTGYLNERKKNNENNVKNLSFFYARNDEMLHAWQTAIRQNAFQSERNKVICKKDRVCELHFKEMDIEREYVTRLSNGDIFRMPKGRVTLKAGAIPCIEQFRGKIFQELLELELNCGTSVTRGIFFSIHKYLKGQKKMSSFLRPEPYTIFIE